MILEIDDEKLQAQADSLMATAADRALKDVMREYGFESNIKKRIAELVATRIDKIIHDTMQQGHESIEKAVHDALQKMIEAKAKTLLRALEKQ